VGVLTEERGIVSGDRLVAAFCFRLIVGLITFSATLVGGGGGAIGFGGGGILGAMHILLS
jgi:hypothetical protein